jgi:hypothetical protein
MHDFGTEVASARVRAALRLAGIRSIHRRIACRGKVATVAIASMLLAMLPAVASAQFFVDTDAVPSGPAACTTAGVNGTLTPGSVVLNLPNALANAYSATSVNGAPAVVQLQTVSGPFPTAFPAVVYSLPLTALTPLPYTVTASEFAALNGSPVGTGIVFVIACDINGVGSAQILRGVAAPAPLSVPTLPAYALMVLATLLALLAAWGLARRPR